jgi:hypothetical protein
MDDRAGKSSSAVSHKRRERRFIQMGTRATRDPQPPSSRRTSPLRAPRAGECPCKRGLLRGCNGRRVHRQLQVPQNFHDDASVGNGRDDAQPTLLTHRAVCHVNRKDPLEQLRPRPSWARLLSLAILRRIGGRGVGLTSRVTAGRMV